MADTGYFGGPAYYGQQPLQGLQDYFGGPSLTDMYAALLGQKQSASQPEQPASVAGLQAAGPVSSLSQPKQPDQMPPSPVEPPSSQYLPGQDPKALAANLAALQQQQQLAQNAMSRGGGITQY